MDVLEELLSGLKQVCAGFPDKRKGGAATYSMADIGLSAFSLFFMQSESCLDYQRGLEAKHMASNCQTLFGMTKIPTDNHIRSMLDPVDPAHLQPCFDASIDMLRQRGGLKEYERLGGRTLIALDGTEYFCSQKLGCPATKQVLCAELPDPQALEWQDRELPHDAGGDDCCPRQRQCGAVDARVHRAAGRP